MKTMTTDEMYAVYDGENDNPRCYCATEKDAHSVAEVLECRWPDVYVKAPTKEQETTGCKIEGCQCHTQQH